MIHELQEKLESLSERELQSRVVVPLMYHFGYEKVDEHGGPDEKGKDLICWRTDELGEIELGVVQLKLFKSSASASDNRGFANVVTQLSQAADEGVPHTDGNMYHASRVYFVSPFSLDTRALSARFEGYTSLKHVRPRIIDGAKLAKLVAEKLPEVAAALLGPLYQLKSLQRTVLDNSALMDALDVREHRDISTFYCDIAFEVGRKTSRLLLLGDAAKPIKKRLSLSEARWKALRRLDMGFASEFNSTLFTQTQDTIVAAYNKTALAYEDARKRGQDAEQVARDARNRCDLTLRSMTSSLDQVEGADLPQWFGLARDYARILEREVVPALNSEKGTPDNASWVESLLDARFEKVQKDLTRLHAPGEVIALIRDARDAHRDAWRAWNNERSLKAQLQRPAYTPTLDGPKIRDTLESMRSGLVSHIERANAGCLSNDELGRFLGSVSQQMGLASRLLLDDAVAVAVGIDDTRRIRAAGNENLRLNIRVHDVFDTGLNVAVFGAAGAGKTTTLQMYAKRCLEAAERGRTALFAPLSRLYPHSLDTGADTGTNEIDLPARLQTYLTDRGIKLPSSGINSILRKKGTVVLLDGIDEAIRSAPDLLTEIKKFAKKFPTLQVVTSSREDPKYLEKIPFLGITLLPFTAEQRSDFVRGWFSPQGATKADVVLRHLANFPHVAEIIQNPLLATILCVLASHDVPLPDTEYRLYDERLRLLLGDYDLQRKVQRLQSKREELGYVARKAAFLLHKEGVRYGAMPEIAEAIVGATGTRMSPDRVRLAVSELAYPCNVLVPMTDDGKFGFGHLRYQEFLVALELHANRAVRIRPLLDQPWWRGALILFAQIVDSLDWLVEQLGIDGELNRPLKGLIAMIEARPLQEQERLRTRMSRLVNLDEAGGSMEWVDELLTEQAHMEGILGNVSSWEVEDDRIWGIIRTED